MSRVGAAYRAIRAANRPEVFVYLRSQARVEAEYQASVAAAGPLAGLLLAVKDNVDVAGIPTTAGCPDFSYLPTRDAAAVAALRAAGAVVVGKTNLDQFATGLVGARSPYGAVRDARRPAFASGGSSSGSAVAVALGFCDIAIGTDTAGSGRVPAGLQGVVGIKPTLGVVKTDGVVPACASYDCVTVLAPDLALAERAMGAMAGGAGGRAWPMNAALAAHPHARIAVPKALPELDERWQRAFADAVNRVEEAGMEVVPIDATPFLAAAKLLYEGALVAERWDAVGEFLQPRLRAKDTAGLDPTVTAIIAGGRGLLAVDLLRDRRRVRQLREQAMEAMRGCAALMVPTAPFHPTIAEVRGDPVGVNARMGTYTNFCNLFDLCAIAVPAGHVHEGERGDAQFGVTFLGRAFDDAVVADIARRTFSAGLAGVSWPEAAGVQASTLAVFGAHLRGQPLEHQLLDRGARWVGPVATAPSYRMFELATTPPKPGVVRVGSGGAAIEGEAWVLSAAALGSFLAQLPAPMQLGAVELADGTWVTGFGCDPSATATARDVTEFGSWRALLAQRVPQGARR